MAKEGLNGSANLLADAMRRVFAEATTTDLETTNENAEAQLTQHRKDVAADIQEALKGE